MKIYILGNENTGKLGGGWSWLANFVSGDWDITTNPEECDIYLITSISMLDKLSQIPKNKKIVLRIDNVLKNSNNKLMYGLNGDQKITRMEALKQVAQIADLIIYQSCWAENYIKPFLGDCRAKQTVIYNGVDQTIFKEDGGRIPHDNKLYLYSRSSNHDNKGWHIAWYEWQMIQRREPKSELWIMGRFSPENIPNNFDFFNNENWKYMGFITDKEQLALYYRSADYFLYSFFNDACSNTTLEMLSSGVEIINLSNTGGMPEIMENYKKYGHEWLSLERMNSDYKKAFESILP